MQTGVPIVSLDEATFFVNVAVISGALIGLTFIALNLFMVDMLRRYEGTALPVFRERETKDSARRPSNLKLPESLTDFELLDGDPVVVFMAFSVAVSWSLFLLPLVIGLTEAWNRRWGVLSAEMFVFSGVIASNFVWRNHKVKQMRPYLTREELWWPLMSGTAFLLYLSTATVLLLAAFPNIIPLHIRLSAWNALGFTFEQAGAFLLKTSCIASLVLGTYTVNKDMFIYFKAASSETMRGCWLKEFFANRYSKLDERVHHATSHMSPEEKQVDWLWNQWNEGPTSISDHGSFNGPRSEAASLLWKKLVESRGKVPVWMLDIPSIARWSWDLENELNARKPKR
jgi:hypothetical protein